MTPAVVAYLAKDILDRVNRYGPTVTVSDAFPSQAIADVVSRRVARECAHCTVERRVLHPSDHGLQFEIVVRKKKQARR